MTSVKDSHFEEINPDQSYIEHIAEQPGYTPLPKLLLDIIMDKTLLTIITISYN
jgi:hypothetical protein